MSSDDIHPIRFESTAAQLRAALDGPADLNGRADPDGRPGPGAATRQPGEVSSAAAVDLLAYLRDKAGAGRLERGAAVPAAAGVLAAGTEEALR